jgi:S-adenosylmethionine decarboxylase
MPAMQGLHLTADLRGCDARIPAMTETAILRRLCLDAVSAAGLQAVGELFHRFAPASAATAEGSPTGITGVVLLAESHLAVHTWPEMGAVTLDVYVCNFGADNSQRAHDLLQRLKTVFSPKQAECHVLERGRTPLNCAAEVPADRLPP